MKLKIEHLYFGKLKVIYAGETSEYFTVELMQSLSSPYGRWKKGETVDLLKKNIGAELILIQD